MNEIALAQPTAPAPVAEVPAIATPQHVAVAMPDAVTGPAFEWLPAKYQVHTDGQLDLLESTRKMANGYAAAERRLGTISTAPDSPAEYQVTLPDYLANIDFPADHFQQFMDQAHAHGFGQEQFDFVMDEYFKLVPTLIEVSAKVRLQKATGELSRVWPNPEQRASNMAAAERAVDSMPPDLQEALKDEFGASSTFWRFAAEFGRELPVDDTLEQDPARAGGALSLMQSDAYRNTKHPDHASTSAKVQRLFARAYGTKQVLE